MDTVDFVVTDGSVEYRHSKPKAEYESIAPMVRLNFTIDEGSDPLIVTNRVMAMAVRIVETTLYPQSAVEKENPPEVVAKSAKSKSVKAAEPPLHIHVPDEDNKEQNAPKLDLKADVQPMAQKVSAHLAKVDGNINKLRAVIKECGGNSLLTIPEENWPLFMERAKELLP